MTSTTTLYPPAKPPADAHCRGCGYALRELTTHRCPECGRGFDPADPRTMDLQGRRLRTRLVEWLASPIDARVRRTVLAACGTILWGAAWLPGAFVVEGIGWIVLALAVTYGIARRVARRLTRMQRGQPPLPRPPSERYSRRQTLLVALAMSSPIVYWPLQLNVLIHRPLLDRYAWHVYAERPMIEPPATPRMVGGFLVAENQAHIRGVTVQVFGGGRMYWSDDGRFRDYSGDEPWYARWVVRVRCGPWYIGPQARLETLWPMTRWLR